MNCEGKPGGDYTTSEEAKRMLDEMDGSIDAVVETCGESPKTEGLRPEGFMIEELPDRYRLLNVDYNGEKWNFDWLKQLLTGGNKPQNTWLSETKKGDVRLPNSMMVYANIAALYANRNHPDPAQKSLVEKVVAEIFKPDITENHPHTSSRVAYRSQGVDRVTHNLGYVDQFSIDENIVGPSARVNDSSGLEGPINALLGTSNLAEVEQVYKWLSGKKPYLWRFDQKPGRKALLAVVFGFDDVSNGFGIVADGDIFSYWPARGMSVKRVETGGLK